MSVFDRVDDIFLGREEWEGQGERPCDEAERFQLEQERQQATLEALDNCKAAGSPEWALDVLASECGLSSQWRQRQSG